MGDEGEDDTPPFQDETPTPRAMAPVQPYVQPAGPSQDSQLDCCSAPKLLVLKQLYVKEHDTESLEQCANCGTPWFHRWHEHDSTSWYSPLTPEEAGALQVSRDNIGYLATRRSIMFDSKGKKVVDGAPTDPWT